MKTCTCGGMFYRHGRAVWNKSQKSEGERYRCKSCGKCITVRNGEVATFDRVKRDWRFDQVAA